MQTLMGLAALVMVAGAVSAQEQWEGLPADFQAVTDRQAAAAAAEWRYDLVKGKAEPARNIETALDPKAHPWQPVTDALVIEKPAYPIIPGYRHHLEARADLDRDGKQDVARLVDNGRQGAIQVTFGDRRKPPAIIMRTTRMIGGQGLFPAGKHAIMLNQPEVNVVFVFMRGGRFMNRFYGD